LDSHKRFVLVLGCSLFMTGCTTVGKGVHDISEGFKSFGTDVAQMFSTEYGAVGAPVDVDINNHDVIDPPFKEMPTANMAQYTSDSSVDVYSLDGAARVVGGSSPPAPAGGVAYGGDSSVVVYPVEGGATQSYPRTGTQTPYQAPYQAPYRERNGFLPMSGQSTGPQSSLPSSSRGREQARVYFDHNSAKLSQSARKTIGNVARATPGSVRVEGHASTKAATADPVRRHIINLKTAMDRAFSVSRELISKGVPAESIVTSAYGDTRPAVEGEKASRRVEIYNAASY